MYYAKSFTVNITNSNGNYFKGGAGLPIPQWSIQQTQSIGKPTSKTKTVTQSNAPSTPQTIATSPPLGMDQLNTLIRDNVEKALAENSYGGTVSSLNMSSKGVSYTGDFNAPVAIAYKGPQYIFKIIQTKTGDGQYRYDIPSMSTANYAITGTGKNYGPLNTSNPTK